MWERLETFWDGQRTLLLGIFDGDRAPLAAAREIAVFSRLGTDENASSTLLDVIPTDHQPRYWLVSIPEGHRHITVQSAAGKGAAGDLQLSLVSPADIGSGSWHLLIAGAPSDATTDLTLHVVERRAVPANREQFWERQVADSGILAVAGLLQHRSVQDGRERRRVQLAPLRSIWPRRDSRITVEPVARPSQSRRERYRNMNPDFSILSLWLQEAPPPVVLRVSPGEVGGTTDRLLGQTAVVHVMHQRLRLNKSREQAQQEGDPPIEVLTFQDMQEALGELGEEAPFVAATEGIVAFNLFEIIDAAKNDPYEADGISVRQVGASASAAKSIEIEFPGASLGDDVGIVSNWANPGQLFARPQDPSGSPQARLFRVGDNELRPLTLDETYPPFDDVMQLAGEREIGIAAKSATEPANAEQLSAAARVVSSFRARLGHAAGADFIDNAKGHGWDAIVTAAYVGTVTAHGERSVEAAQHVGGYDTFLDDPAIVAAVARNPNLIDDLPFFTVAGRRSGGAGHLAARFAGVLGMPELVDSDLTGAAQIQAWRVIRVVGAARKLAATRIRLEGSTELLLRAELIADTLFDLPSLEKAIISLRDRQELIKDAAQQADELADYAGRRRKSEWTALPDADSLAQIMNGVTAYWRKYETDIETPATKSSAPNENRSPADLLEALKQLLVRARALRPAPEGLASLEAHFQSNIEGAAADRFVLQNLEARLLNLVDAPAQDEQLEKVVTTLEDWASLPNFARRIAPRLASSEALHEIVTAYVDRVARWMPRRQRQGGNLDQRREEMVRAIETRLAPTRAGGPDRKQIAPVVARYGEILLLHQAYKVVDEIIDSLQGRDELSHELHRLKHYLGTWPAQAANTWDQALVLARAHLPAQAQQLSNRISPPTFDAAS